MIKSNILLGGASKKCIFSKSVPKKRTFPPISRKGLDDAKRRLYKPRRCLSLPHIILAKLSFLFR